MHLLWEMLHNVIISIQGHYPLLCICSLSKSGANKKVKKTDYNSKTTCRALCSGNQGILRKHGLLRLGVWSSTWMRWNSASKLFDQRKLKFVSTVKVEEGGGVHIFKGFTSVKT